MGNEELKFHLSWSEEVFSLVNVSASIGEIPVWPAIDDLNTDLEVFADDILAFLAENWHSLCLEQTYPLYNPVRPSKLHVIAEGQWEQNESLDSEFEAIQIMGFERSHNLSTCFSGITGLSPLWFMRRGDSMIVDNGVGYWQLPYRQIHKALADLGDSIAERLSGVEKLSPLLNTWKNRINKTPIALLAAAVGMTGHRVKKLVANGLLRAPRNFDEASNDDDELRIAARMSGSLEVDEINSILSAAQGFLPVKSQHLLDMRQRVFNQISEFDRRKSHDIGVEAAILAREFLGYDSSQRIDLQDVLSRLEIEYKSVADLTEKFKGLAIWGGRHGPGILIKDEKENPFNQNFARVTIAHELGHLLMDSNHTVGAVDVLRGRAPADMETRAKSFAGEFLLPANVAQDAWQKANHPSDVRNLAELIENLKEMYGVTRSVAAWKLEHGLKSLDVNLSDILDLIAPGR